ncbi:hypothetical protein ACQVTX_23720 [Bacillus pretiosus]|uniref:hypothetical protein n=1 Tax=Bacillus pretiosus TaxID=2983392 RepID=UPI003D64D358
MNIISQLSELYKKLRLNDFSNHNEESQAMTKSNELEIEFKKMYLKKKKQKEKLEKELKDMDEFIVESEMEFEFIKER